MTEINPKMIRYAIRITNPNQPEDSPFAIFLIMSQLWESGRNEMTCLNPIGIWSVEKKVLHRNDIGMMM